jgi:hypothetical protein
MLSRSVYCAHSIAHVHAGRGAMQPPPDPGMIFALVRQSPSGKAVTYGQVAALLGKPRAAPESPLVQCSVSRGSRRDVTRKGCAPPCAQERQPITGYFAAFSIWKCVLRPAPGPG